MEKDFEPLDDITRYPDVIFTKNVNTMNWRIQALSEHQEKPIISIVIPVYNVDMFLRKALSR